MIRRVGLVVLLLLTIVGCQPDSGVVPEPAAEPKPDAGHDEFRSANIARTSAAFKQMYESDLDEAAVTVVTLGELGAWIAGGPMAERELPCELGAVLKPRDGGDVDPSPIAFDVSASSPTEGVRMIYVPILSAVDCPDPRGGFFLNDVATCEDGTEEQLLCNGQKGDCATCECIFGCGFTGGDLCTVCPD